MRLTFTALVLATVFVSCRTPAPEVAELDKVNVPVEDRIVVSVTLHGREQALVQEVRTIRLEPGYQELRFMGVSDKIISESVQVSARDDSCEVDFSEQNYNTNFIEPDRILKKAVDTPIRVYSVSKASGEEQMQNGILRSSDDGLVVETEDGIVLLDENARIELDEVPKELVNEPVLSWLTHSDEQCTTSIAISYLTKGISWKADYVVDLAPSGDIADVRALATLENKTSLSIDDTRVRLSTRDVHPYMYESGRTLDLRPNQDEQIALLEASNVPVSKSELMIVDLDKIRVKDVMKGLVLKLDRSGDSPLNMHLPSGRAAIWTEDPESEIRFQIGERVVENSAVGEPFEILMPGDLLVYGEWVQMREVKDSEGRRLIEGELTLKSGRSVETGIEILLVVPGGGSIRVEVDGKKVEQKNSGTWTFKTVIGPSQDKKLTIRTRPF